jgi:hypothetical protein
VDAELVATYSWHPVKIYRQFYAQTRVSGKSDSMHRLIRPDITGEIDHADRDGLNNTSENLRPATRAQQNANTRPSRNSTSAYKGVCWNKQKSRWQVEIRASGGVTP